jgi:hypothetical protein
MFYFSSSLFRYFRVAVLQQQHSSLMLATVVFHLLFFICCCYTPEERVLSYCNCMTHMPAISNLDLASTTTTATAAKLKTRNTRDKITVFWNLAAQTTHPSSIFI